MIAAEPIFSQDEEQKPPKKELQQRYDGRDKDTGKAKYAGEFNADRPVYALMVQSTVPNGILAAIDQTAAGKAYGVLAVLTPFNAPKLPGTKPQPPASRHITVLQEPEVFYNGQPIAVVVANTLDQARYAASLLKITYKQQPAKLDFKDRLRESRPPKNPGREPAETHHGDLNATMAKAAVTVDVTYSTPIQNHNPMEPHSTIARWDVDGPVG